MVFDLIIVMAIVLLVAVGSSVILRVGRHPEPRSWEISERSLGNGIEIRLIKRGQTPFVIGQASRGEMFDMDLAELKAEAKATKDDLNRKFLGS